MRPLQCSFWASLNDPCSWGSWAIIFTGIFHLRDNTDPSTSSRAPYTYRLVRSVARSLEDVPGLMRSALQYQVVALMFFFILILSIEKLVILAIVRGIATTLHARLIMRAQSLNFHRVAYADRINKTTNALGILDKLRDYRPKRKAARPASSRNASTEFLGTFRPGHGRPKSGAATPPTSFPPAVTTAPPKKHRWWRRRSSEEYDDVELAPRTKGSPTDSPANLSKENLAAETPSGNATQAPSVGGDMLKGQNQGTKLGSFFSRRGANAAQIARAAMKDPLAVVGKRSGFAIDVNSPLEAKHLARSLFRAFKTDPKRAYLIPSDLFPAFPTEEKAREAFELFDRDGAASVLPSGVRRSRSPRQRRHHPDRDQEPADAHLQGAKRRVGRPSRSDVSQTLTTADFHSQLSLAAWPTCSTRSGAWTGSSSVSRPSSCSSLPSRSLASTIPKP